MASRFKKTTSDIFGTGVTGEYFVDRGSNNVDWIKDFRGRKKSKERTTTNQSLVSFLDKKTFKIWFAVLLLGLVILFSKVSYLQFAKGDYYKSVAEGNRVRIRDVKASRGVIYDRYGSLLVKNIPNFSLVVVPVDLPRDEKFDEVVKYLEKISGKNSEEIIEIIKNEPSYSYRPVVIKEGLNYDQAILSKIENFNYPGVGLKVDSAREYLYTDEVSSLSHIMGYLGKINPDKLEGYMNSGYSFDDKVGKSGLEISYEEKLKGRNGKEYVEVNAFGDTKQVLDYLEPITGMNLTLTLDLELQRELERSLKENLKKYNKEKASAVVMDPNNGEILAMVSLPAFDSNLFSLGISQEDLNRLFTDETLPMFNRSISGEYPSGSTFKLVVAAAALEEKIITPSTGFSSVGGIRISQWFFPDWKAGGHGWTTVTKALSESVNTFFYIIGGGYENFTGLGVKKMKEYAEQFGLNQELGIDLPGEASGFFPSPEWKEEVKDEIWYIGDTYHVAIGQGDILVTPLQVAAWTSVFANDGTLYQPHLLKQYSRDEKIHQAEFKILNKGFISKDTLDIVNKGLRQTVTTGSGRALLDLPITAAAKTGTAQWSTRKEPHAWFTAYAPYEDPNIVVTVLIEEGEGGSTTPVPVVKDVLNWWAENRVDQTN